MSDVHDSWIQDAFGVDVDQVVQKIKDEASTTVNQAVNTVTTVVDEVRGAVDGAIDATTQAVTSAAKKIAGAVAPGSADSATGSSGGAATGSFPLRSSVGRGGKNAPGDVRAVQMALGLAVDGQCGPRTIAAIESFQRQQGHAKPDGRVDAGGATERALASGTPSSPQAASPQAAADDGTSPTGMVDGLLGQAEQGLKNAVGQVTDLGGQVAQGVSDLLQAAPGAALADIGRGGPLNQPSYVAGSGGPQGDGNASAGDSEFVTGYKSDLADRVVRLHDLVKKLYKLSEDIDSKGHHWFSSNDASLLSSAKTINDAAKSLAVLAAEIDSWQGSLNKDSVKKGTDATKYAGYVLNAADFVVAVKDYELAADNLGAGDKEAAVNAWADNVGNLFDKAGGLIDMIPNGALPGFITSYYKGLFGAPKNYISAFKSIMKEHYAYVNKEGHMPSSANQQAFDMYEQETVWEGELTGVFVGAYTQPKSRDAMTLQDFMRKHRDEEGLDLYKAHLVAGREALCHRIEANLAGDDPARDAWIAYVHR